MQKKTCENILLLYYYAQYLFIKMYVKIQAASPSTFAMNALLLFRCTQK